MCGFPGATNQELKIYLSAQGAVTHPRQFEGRWCDVCLDSRDKVSSVEMKQTTRINPESSSVFPFPSRNR